MFGSLWIACAVYLARLMGVYMGSWLGCWVSGVPPESRKRLWAGMVTQAGIALGLAKTVASRFPSWGPDFAGAMAAAIVINLFSGPLMFKAAVEAMGEARQGGGSSSSSADGLPLRASKPHDDGDNVSPPSSSPRAVGRGGSVGGSMAVEMPAIVLAAVPQPS